MEIFIPVWVLWLIGIPLAMVVVFFAFIGGLVIWALSRPSGGNYFG